MDKNQSPEFYVNSGDTESLWEGERYYVIRNGEMRIHYADSVIRYTDQLQAVGIKTDYALEVVMDTPAEEFDVIDNPWFEVVDSADPTDDGEVYYRLDDAVERAQVLEARHAGTLSI